MNEVNFFDIVTLLVGLWAIISGWRRGVILQLGSLIGIVLSLYLAARYASEVGRWLHFDESWAAPGGFILVGLTTLIAVALIGRLLRKLFRFAGLGIIDILLGITISLVKWLLLLSAIYSAFGALNRSFKLVQEPALEQSHTYYPVCHVADYLLPFVSEVLEENEWSKWLPDPSNPSSKNQTESL